MYGSRRWYIARRRRNSAAAVRAPGCAVAAAEEALIAGYASVGKGGGRVRARAGARTAAERDPARAEAGFWPSHIVATVRDVSGSWSLQPSAAKGQAGWTPHVPPAAPGKEDL